MEYSLVIILVPLFMFLLLGLAGKKMQPKMAGILGTLGLAVITCLSYYIAYQYFFVLGKADGVYQQLRPFDISWLKFTETLVVHLGILLDPISVMMLVVITTVSLMVHLYSLGYMKGEKGFQRYYAFLSLFSFSMLGLVVANNIFQMYIFWELVGVSSYSLIGFYYTKPSAVAAAKKAFIVTRFADLGFLIGILFLSYYTNTFDFSLLTANNASLVAESAGASFLGLSVFTWAMALIFIGGAGKSAMLPLHIWLPDAMEGPTPVSALIHAATMVVAGVYLVARLFPVYYFITPEVLTGIAYVGAATSLFAAIVACTQTDIKRVLAFSTISQIAYMMVALGVSGYGGHDGLGYMSSMFHLFTHAFFKALLFLGAGAVIHAVHSNEMKDMGGLRKYLPITHITFLIACLAIAGIPPFSGFFSKDEIMVVAFHSNKMIFACQFLVAGLTAFYMFRLYYNIFWGKEREFHHKPHEAGAVMTIPLIFLAVLSIVTGFIPFSSLVTSDGAAFPQHIEWSIAIPSILVALIGIGTATWVYKNGSDVSDKIVAKLGVLYTWAYHKFYFDELYMFVTKNIIFRRICTPIAWFDKNVVDGFMNFQAFWVYRVSSSIKGLQSGNVQQYVWVFVMSAIIIASLVIFL
ncbi:MAG: NADH-quinone oxidoreductase subunit L [Candidatus Azobacteroides sp.]|nr:NADH-quinone oxidoreductase subunit L [Candidatus Azobacteroides sp.]